MTDEKKKDKLFEAYGLNRVSEETELRIRKASQEGKIVFESSFEIEDYEVEAQAFLELIGLDVHDCFLSDRSSVQDFFGCGDCEPQEGQSALDYQAAWQAWISQKLLVRFGVTKTGNMLILDLCKEIRAKASTVGSGLN